MTGLFLLSSWTGDVLSQTAWKVCLFFALLVVADACGGQYACPNNALQGDDIADYERVVRYNYDKAELTALVELIGYIKR